jgi:hypothetical protein
MPYVSNDQRIRLGLQQWGSDVPQHVLDAALTAVAEPVAISAPLQTTTSAKRARARRRQFQADDITTEGLNEAYENS